MRRIAVIAFLIALVPPAGAAASAIPSPPPYPVATPAFAPSAGAPGVPSLSVSPYT
jgi:hypothetical protein